MEVNQYVFKVIAVYNCKNKLYKEFQAFAQQNDRTLIVGQSGLRHFKKMFNAKLEELQEKHSRCKKLRFEMSDGYSKDVHCRLSDFGSWIGQIYKVNNVLKEK